MFSSVIDLVLNCIAFIYIGAWIPFDQFNQAELGITPWRLVVLSLIILTLRRIPFLLMLYKVVPEIANWRQALFAGHFGQYFLKINRKGCFGSDVLNKILDRSCEFNGHSWEASRPFYRLIVDRRWSGVRIDTCHHTPREDSKSLSKPTIFDCCLAPNRRLHRSLFHRRS